MEFLMIMDNKFKEIREWKIWQISENYKNEREILNWKEKFNLMTDYIQLKKEWTRSVEENTIWKHKEAKGWGKNPYKTQNIQWKVTA